MNNIAEKIMNSQVPEAGLHIYWLGGAGFIIKEPQRIIGIDIYLSDFCKNANGDFKRLIPPPFDPEDIKLDVLIATHEHGDHFDEKSLSKLVNKKTGTRLIGTGTVVKRCQKLGIEKSLVFRLDRNEKMIIDGITISGVLSDHGVDSPDAIGVIIEINGKNIYFTGDTCYSPQLTECVSINTEIDLLIVPINGKYGNSDSKEAAYITAWVRPKVVVPCHFWLFKEHGGDPGEFLEYCHEIVPDVKANVLAIGELLLI